MRRAFAAFLVVALCSGGPAWADEKPPEKKAESASEAGKKEPPKPEQSITQHAVTIGGVAVPYTATAGTMIVRNEKDEPWASIGYFAYVRRDAAAGARRPITFAYNGGPGSSSIWLHMGALGPRRVVVQDVASTPPPPYRVVDNAYSILDKSDLVLIDPVGTGISKAVGDFKDKDFWTVDSDIESVSRFILQYVSDNGRWNSPKFLLGESYGTTRSAGVVDWLQSNGGMAFNGVVLVSLAMDLNAVFAIAGNDLPYALLVPSYAATAWYHKLVPNAPSQLEPWLTEVRKFAAGDYAEALAEGDRLSDEHRSAVIAKLHAYTGLSEEYLRLANLRVSEGEYTQELLRPKRTALGRLDSRFEGIEFDPLAKEMQEDPAQQAIQAAYTAAFLDWYHQGLKFGQGKTYTVMGSVWKSWDYKHQAPGAPFPLPTLTNTGIDLAHAMTSNPNLRVLVLSGYFDLATPFFASEYQISHLGLEKAGQDRIEMKYYPAGHMMYVNEPSLKALQADVETFIERASRQ